MFRFRALFTYEGNSNDVRVAGTGGEYGHAGHRREVRDVQGERLGLLVQPSQEEEGDSGCTGVPPPSLRQGVLWPRMGCGPDSGSTEP